MKACKVCRVKFQPVRPLQSVCSPACAVAFLGLAANKAKLRAVSEDRKKTRAALAKLKTRAMLIREAQTAVNAWIRYRDRDLPCVSCGRMHEGQWHAGHYRSAGSRPDLRFDEANIHKQCAPCNTHLSGNPIPYRVTLLDRIGYAELARLEGPPTAIKLTREEIIALRDSYRARLKHAQKSI